MVPRFRALRESLLSNNAPLPFFTEALEASSDTCLRAGSFPEFLKSVQQLVLASYPALAAEDQVSQSHRSYHARIIWLTQDRGVFHLLFRVFRYHSSLSSHVSLLRTLHRACGMLDIAMHLKR